MPTIRASTPPRSCLSRTVRPTLVVGVGGTGASAAKHVKARLDELIGGQQPYLAIRVFDTDVQSDEPPYLVEGTEYIYLGGFNAQAVIADIDPDGALPASRRAYPHWTRWLPPRLSHQQVAVGAGGIRPIGRLCYFYRREQIREAVLDALQRITDPERALALEKERGLHLAPGITIHLCCSVCGGTGSGMFLDLAYDLRRWAERHTASDVTVVGHLVLPEAFRGKPVVDRALRANSYIALQELDHFMNARPEEPWEVEYHAGEPEQSRRAPFDTCYLLSAGENGGLSIEDLTAAMGEAVVLLTSFEAGHIILKGETNTANQSKAKIDAFGRSCCYSSYGVIGIDVPTALIAEHLVDQVRGVVAHQAQSAGDAALETWMRETAEQRTAALERLVDDKLLKVGRSWVDTALTARYWSNAGAQAVTARRGPMTWLLGERGQEGSEVQSRRSEAREKLIAAVATADRDVAQKLAARLAEPLLDADGWLSATLADGGDLLRSGRIADLVHYLELLRDRLQRLEDSAEERARNANTEALKQEPVVKEVRNGGGTLGESWWDEVDRGLREHWVRYHQAYTDERLWLRYHDEVRELRKRLTRWVDRLGVLLSVVASPQPTATPEAAYDEEHRGRSSVVPIERLVSGSGAGGGEPGLFDDIAGKIGPTLVADLATDRRWLDRSESEPDTRTSVERECRHRVRDFLDVDRRNNCETLLRDSMGGYSEPFERRMLSFWERARPAWTVAETYPLRTNILEITAVGAVRGTRMLDVLLKRDRRIQPTASQCPDYVPILCTEHGLSLIGLRTLPEYRQAFLDAVQQEQRFDFHFFLDTRWTTEIEFPDEPRDDLRDLALFSLAVELGIVRRVATNGYQYSPADGGPDEVAPRRWSMFEKLMPRRSHELEARVREALERAAGPGHNGAGDLTRVSLARVQTQLVGRVSAARGILRGKRSPESEVNLSRDLFQLHREIRAARFRLRPADIHPEDEHLTGGHAL